MQQHGQRSDIMLNGIIQTQKYNSIQNSFIIDKPYYCDRNQNSGVFAWKEWVES